MEYVIDNVYGTVQGVLDGSVYRGKDHSTGLGTVACVAKQRLWSHWEKICKTIVLTPGGVQGKTTGDICVSAIHHTTQLSAPYE